MSQVTSRSLTPSDPVVHYRFIPSVHGVTMELWEPKPSVSSATPGYQFCLRRQFTSERDALAALQQYLSMNAIATAIASRTGYDQALSGETGIVTMPE